MNYAEYLKTETWKTIRRLALESANYKCQLCNSSKNLNVHHRKYPKELGKESLADLTVLCFLCHKKAHDAKMPHCHICKCVNKPLKTINLKPYDKDTNALILVCYDCMGE
jgi:BarA-like signal transduction histidine kinase